MAVAAALAHRFELSQGIAQCLVGAFAFDQFLGLGQHRRAEGLHALWHGHVLQRLVFDLGARADGANGNGEVFHAVFFLFGGDQWQLLSEAEAFTTGMPMVGARDLGAARASPNFATNTSQSCMPDSVVT